MISMKAMLSEGKKKRLHVFFVVLTSKHASGDATMSLFLVINIQSAMTACDNRRVCRGYQRACHIWIFLSRFIFYQVG